MSPSVEESSKNPPKMDVQNFENIKDDQVVISGMSGLFPKSDNVKEFMENLYNKVDMVIGVDPKFSHPDVPKHLGKINGLNKFDAQFFKVTFNQTLTCDPMCRKIMEHAYSAIYDSGINPMSIRGEKIGVFVATSYMDSVKESLYADSKLHRLFLSGCAKTMLPNRISYFIDGKGPSFNVDASCTSSLFCLELAYRSMINGECDAAIVGGTNICKQPTLGLNLRRAGQLCLDGKTKCFDKNGDGYVRAETISIIFLQKAKDAKRIYAQVCHANVRYAPCDVNFLPIRRCDSILNFLGEIYSKLDVQPNEIEYVEANAPGIAEADEEELKAIGQFFATDKPVKVGSVKSNMGHSECVSGLSSLTKALLAYHTGMIPANIHCNNPVEYLKEGKTVVVKDNVPFGRGYIAINNFSYTGLDAHVLLKGYVKTKNLDKYKTNVPYLIVASGRSEDNVHKLFDTIQDYPVDPEYIGMVHSIHNDDIPGHTGRGYVILDKDANDKTTVLSRHVEYYSGTRRPVWFVFSGMGSQWPGMGADLMRIPVFAAAIERCHMVLAPLGLDIVNIITSKDKSTFDNIINSFVGIAAVQIGLIDVVKALEIECDYMIGHSLGEGGCGYADGCFSIEETVLSAYSRAIASLESKVIRGTMAAVGLGYKEILPLCPPEVDIACHNSSESTTISGPSEIISKFTQELTQKGIFAKEVPSGNVAYHSRYIAEAGKLLKTKLEAIITEPKLRSSKWLSTSVPEEKWDEPHAKYCSAEYHANNLMNSVLFEETSRHIPTNALVIEIAPHGLLQAILKRSHSECLHVPLTRRGHENQIKFFFDAIGKIYEAGLNPKVDILYPKIEYPVSTGTQFLSHLIAWEHSEDWPVKEYEGQSTVSTRNCDKLFSIHDDRYGFIEDFSRDDEMVIPETALLVFTWETLAMSSGMYYKDMPVVFRNVNFNSQVHYHPESFLKLSISITKRNGRFEIVHENIVVANGYINEIDDNDEKRRELPNHDIEENIVMNASDVYKLLNLRGHSYRQKFRPIQSMNMKRNKANILWTGQWIAFLDALIQVNILANDHNGLSTPKLIEKLSIDIFEHTNKKYYSKSNGNTIYEANLYQNYRTIRSGGVDIVNVVFEDKPIQRIEPDFLGSKKFYPHFSKTEINLETALQINIQIIADKSLKKSIKVTEFNTAVTSSVVSNAIQKVCARVPVAIDFQSVYITYNELDEIQDFDSNKPDAVAVCDFVMDTRKISTFYKYLPKDAFVLSLEKSINKKYIIGTDYFNVITTYPISGEHVLLLLNKVEMPEISEDRVIVKIDLGMSMSYLNVLRSELRNKKRVILLSERQDYYDITGYLKSLQEEYGNRISLVSILDAYAPTFDLKNIIYTKQLDKNLPINIMLKGEWGGYYYISEDLRSTARNYKLILPKVGDFESFKWEELSDPQESNDIVQVSYAGLSLRDVQKAVAKVKTNNFEFGMDYSGLDSRGKRVMGLISGGSISGKVKADFDLLWPVPQHWTLEEAATVTLPFVHAYYCLAIKTVLRKGKTVFVNGGTGAFGQAIISICLSLQCNIYVSVSDVKKKHFLLKLFPELDESKILNSRHATFYAQLLERTNNKCCDFVINSASGELREAAMKCVASNGWFLDIGQLDMIENKPFGMAFAAGLKNYMGINFSNIFRPDHLADRKKIQLMIAEGITKGIVRPLSRTVFSLLEVPRAFRLLSSNRHRGRALLKMNNHVLSKTNLDVIPRLNLHQDSTYLVIGDQEELSLELLNLLAIRGAKKIILHLKTKTSSLFFENKLATFKTKGVEVKFNYHKLSGREECSSFLKEAEELGRVEGIFILLNTLMEHTQSVFYPDDLHKVTQNVISAVLNLDKMSREYSSLRYFVVLTRNSVNMGDKYVFSICNKVCQSRSDEGFPALHYHAEYVDELQNNFSADNKILRPQRIVQVLTGLETSLKLKYNDVLSFNKNETVKTNISYKIARIIGNETLRDCDKNLQVGEFMLDEPSLEEIRSVIKENYKLDLPVKNIQDMTLNSLINFKYGLDTEKHKFESNLSAFFSFVDSDTYLATDPIIPMTTSLKYHDSKKIYEIDPEATYMMLIPGFEGHHRIFKLLSQKLKLCALTLQLGSDLAGDSIPEMAKNIFGNVLTTLDLKKKFYLLGYSFGVNVALELAALIEQNGGVGVVFCLDSSPDALRVQLDAYMGKLHGNKLENAIASHMFNLMTGKDSKELNKEISKCDTFAEKVDLFVKHVKSTAAHPQEFIRTTLESAYKRILLAREYQPSLQLNSEIILIKGIPHPNSDYLPHDYNLSKYAKAPVKILNIESDHVVAPFDCRVSNFVNKMLDKKIVDKFNFTNRCFSYSVEK